MPDCFAAPRTATRSSGCTITIVDWRELAERCSRAAAGCYSRRSGNRGVMVVPAGRSAELAHTVVHEYGHHSTPAVGAGASRSRTARPSGGRREGWPSSSPSEACEITTRSGWDRSIGEVFAEDYAYTNLHGIYKIEWLQRPTTTIQQAIRADLGLAPAPVIGTPKPALKPVVIVREGTLGPDERVTIDFGLLGPNRLVRLQGLLNAGTGTRGRVEVTCGSALRSRQLSSAATVSLELARAGPGQCEASISNTGASTGRFRFTVRLALPG